MTYNVINRASGKMVRNAVDMKPFTFANYEDAQKFADSCEAKSRVDSVRNGKRFCHYQVVPYEL